MRTGRSGKGNGDGAKPPAKPDAAKPDAPKQEPTPQPKAEAPKKAPAKKASTSDPGSSGLSATGGTKVVQAGEARLARFESLRGTGMLLVFQGHAYKMSNLQNTNVLHTYVGHLPLVGALALVMFFSLGGYLLFWPFAKEIWGGGKRVNLRGYFWNRFIRMMPLYLFAVVVLMILTQGGGTLTNWIRYLTLTTNFDTNSLHMDPPLWSVSVEMHFYILLPFLAMFLAWISPYNMRVAVVFLLVTGIASFLLHVLVVVPQNADPLGLPGSGPVAKSLPGKWFFFVPGLLVAMLRVKWMHGGPKWLKGPLAYANFWMLIAWSLSFLVAINWRWWNPIPGMPGAAIGPVPDFCVIFFFAIGALALPLKQGILVRWLDWRPFALLGVISYSFYVWHRVIIDAFVGRVPWNWPELMAVSLPIVFTVSILSYKFVEAPFLKRRKRWSDAAAQQRRPEARPAKGTAAPEPAAG